MGYPSLPIYREKWAEMSPGDDLVVQRKVS